MIAEFIITMLGAILGCIIYQKTGKTITDERNRFT